MRKYIAWALQHFLLSRLMLDLNPQSTFSALQYPLIIMSLAQRQIKIKQSPLISHFRFEVYFLFFAGNGVNSIEESHLIRQREFSNYATCQDWNLWDCHAIEERREAIADRPAYFAVSLPFALRHC